MESNPEKTRLIQRRLLISTISNYGAKVLVLGIGFLLTPFILHKIGPISFGLWALAGSVVGYGSLLDLGIAGGLIKYVAEYQARGDVERMGRVVSTALTLYMALGLVTVIIALALAPVFPHIFQISVADAASARWLVILMGVTAGISFPASVTSAVLRGLQRFDLVNVLSSTATLASAGITVMVLVAGGGLLGMVSIGIPLTILMQVPSVWLIKRTAPELRFRPGGSMRDVRQLFAYSWSLFVIQAGGQLQTKTDLLVIARFLPLAAVAPYALALRLADIPQILTDQFLKVLLPLSSELHASSDWDHLRAVYITGTRLTLSLYLPVALTGMFLAPAILTVWVGGQYASSAYLVVILTLAGLIMTSQWPAGAVLQGMARQRALAYSAIVTGIANLGLSIALAHPLGVRGVALGTLIPTTLECLGFVLPYSMRVIGVSAGQLIRDALLPTLLPSIPAVALLLLLRTFEQSNSLLSLIVRAASAMALYGVCYLAVGARGLERSTYRSIVAATARLAREHLP